MVAALQQMRLMAETKAQAQNQVYKQLLGVDNPMYKNIADTIDRKNEAFNSDSTPNNLTGTTAPVKYTPADNPLKLDI